MQLNALVRSLCFALLAAVVCAAQPLPDYDYRRMDSTEVGAAKSAALKAAGLNAVRATYGSSPDLAFTATPSGAPRTLFRRGGVLETAETPGTAPETEARDFLLRRRALFALSSSDLDSFVAARPQSLGRGASIVRFEQQVGGARVWGGSVRIALNARGDVVQVQAGDLVNPASVDPRVELAPAEAALAALQAAGVEASEVEPGPTNASGWTEFPHPRAGALPVVLRRAVFPMFDRSGRMAYRVFADGAGEDSYEIVVDAQSGAVLYRSSVVSRIGEARVWEKSPLEGERTLRPFEPGWIEADSQTTQGNNAEAFLDRNFDSQPDEDDETNVVVGFAFSPTQSFDFPAGDLTTGQDPRAFAAAAVSSMFFHVNRAHDYFYALGFDEAAGNFQKDNFERGGEGDDVMRSAVHAGSSASIIVRPEGTAPRLRTGIRSGGTFSDRTDDADFAYSTQVILHEYAHGVTNRLVGGPETVACLNTRVADGLGEGWSDYYAISYTNDPVLGAYDAPPRPENGIRRASYDANPRTHADLADEGFQEHRDGEIWGATLWDIHQRLGKETTDMLVTAALPLTACDPSMPEAKDAVLMADEMLNEGANLPVLHEIFAARGLGFSSSGKDGFRLSESVVFNAAFDLPPGPNDNRTPVVLSSIASPTEYRTQLTYSIFAEDADGDPLTYTLLRGPDGLTVDDQGVVAWTANEFSPQVAQVEITDGKGGRILHGFSIPIITTLTPNRPVEISSLPGNSGLIQFDVPSGRDLVQFTLRDDSGDPRNDGDLFVFPPSPPLSSSRRTGSTETLTFPAPEAGRWRMQVVAAPQFSGVEVTASYPRIETLPLDELKSGLSGVVSSDTVYRVEIPEGVESFDVVTGEGEGELDLFLAQGRIPVCQGSFLVAHLCDFDEFSVDLGNVERITVEGESEAALSEEDVVRRQVEAGEYFVTVAGFGSYSDASIAVRINDGSPTPEISSGGVVTAANFERFLSAGSIATLFGSDFAAESAAATATPLPTELAGVRVRVEGIDAPLYFMSENQINFQIPYEAEANQFPSIAVIREGRPAPFSGFFQFRNAVEIFLFTNAAGESAAVVVHASDNSVVTPENPARPGAALVAFATGLTEVSNRPATGEASPADPLAVAVPEIEVEVDGRAAQLIFAGLTPGFVGLAQFNFVVPEDVSAGTVTLNISAGFYTSEDVGIAVAP